ncbi:anthrone oxygenase family protein [Galactobacter valiniphilus]|uniref:anthrone oxygenase family protein n=1 Tax=Galactobacter valiniphilus TaxID=2676122 RepID=UPI0037356390
MSVLLVIAAWIAAVLGLVPAGVYLHFAGTVMPRLARLPAMEGMLTMQRFNSRALLPPFMIGFFGAALTSLVVLVCTFFVPSRWGWVAGTGAALHLASFLITVVYNVPRNEALDRLEPRDPRAPAAWAQYQREWSQANRLRAAFATVAIPVLLTAALMRP